MNAITGDTYFAYTEADQAFASTTTLADVLGLNHAINPNEVVAVSINVLFTLGGSLSGYKFALNAPAAPVIFNLEHVISNVSSGLPIIGGLVQSVATLLSGSLTTAGTYSAKWNGVIKNGANVGAIQLQAAQNASQAAALTILKGSSIRMLRLG